MIPKSRKRKHRTQYISYPDQLDLAPPDRNLFIQAHEADLIRGPKASASAKALEVESYKENGEERLRVGDALLRWKRGSGSEATAAETFDDEILQLGLTEAKHSKEEEEESLWVDRYDARLLLDALPTVSSHAVADRPNSPGGWSDLPSDTEDTFFFSADEAEDYRREKRRRIIGQGREARLKALRAEEGDQESEDTAEDEWGGSDEEPDDVQTELMRRTATHILTSPNPAQLEMRILANHGADRRFAFLRGRWSRAWKIMQSHVRMDMEKAKVKKEVQSEDGLGGLTGYGDSDDEASSEKHDKEDDEPSGEAVGGVNLERSEDAESDRRNEEKVKKARRARAKEWAERRRTLKSVDDSGNII